MQPNETTAPPALIHNSLDMTAMLMLQLAQLQDSNQTAQQYYLPKLSSADQPTFVYACTGLTQASTQQTACRQPYPEQPLTRATEPQRVTKGHNTVTREQGAHSNTKDQVLMRVGWLHDCHHHRL